MGQYNKLWAALLGAAAIGLNEAQIVSAPEAEAIVSSGIALLTAFGVYALPNRPK